MLRFAVLSIGSLFWLAQAQEPYRSSHTSQAQVPVVSYCDLIRNEGLYNKKTVTLSARYAVGFETEAFENDPECYSGSGWLVGVTFDESYRSNTDKKVYDSFRRLLQSKKPLALRKVDVTVTGQFNGARESVRLGDEIVTPPYAGRYRYQFVIKKIERAQKVPTR